MTERTGAVSVVELLLVAVLFAAVLAGVARFAAAQSRLAARQHDHLRFEEAVRTAGVVLGSELRHLEAGDIAAAGPDSIRIRAFRGGGGVCALDGERLVVAYAGVRAPDPARDSVVLIGLDTAEARAMVAVRGGAGCHGAVEARLSGPPGVEPLYALFFETGAYSASGGALRYRRGGGGRQPLTEAVLRDAGFTILDGAVRLVVTPDPDSLRWVRPAEILLRIATPGLGAAP